MDFTREPIIETIITPKEGYKLVIRSSKSAGQEEYFVDAVEIVAFGHALFFRSLERPKAFLVPVSDYEALEVKEARMVLKNVGLDRSIKIGGGKEANIKASREEEKLEIINEEETEQEETQSVSETPIETKSEVRVDKKRDRRRHYRKRRGREEGAKETAEPTVPPLEDDKIVIPPPEAGSEAMTEELPATPTLLSSLLQPPPTLISETINRYRQNDLFKNAFYLTEEEQYKPHDKVQELLNEEDEEESVPTLQEPTFETTEQLDEELIENRDASVEEKLEEEITEVTEENVEVPIVVDSEEQDLSQIEIPIYAQEEDTSMKGFTPYTPQQENESIEVSQDESLETPQENDQSVEHLPSHHDSHEEDEPHKF